MTPVKRIALIVIASVLVAYACRAADLIDVTAAVDKQSAYIGDLIKYSITITYDSTLQLTPPAAGANLGGFEVKDYDFGEEQKLDDGRRRQTISFDLRTFTTGDYVIPPLPIQYRMQDSTVKYISADPIKIFIKSVLAEGASVDSLQPRPLKAQASLVGKSKTLWIIIALAAVLIAGGLIYYFMRRRKVVEKAPYVDPRPSWEIAFAELALLKDKDLPGQGEVKPFYFELTEIMKKYFGLKFEFDSADMTTTELDEALFDVSLEEELHRDAISFFEHADLVKFAKYIPPFDRPELDWETAYELVTKSRDMIPARRAKVAPEPVLVAAERDPNEDDSELRFAPPELREYFSSGEPEDKS